MGEDAEEDTSSAVATKPKKKKVNSELDDLVGEMAGRAGDEPVIIPRGAGIAPMAPGPIKADPIPGMDGELFGHYDVVSLMESDSSFGFCWVPRFASCVCGF